MHLEARRTSYSLHADTDTRLRKGGRVERRRDMMIHAGTQSVYR